MKIKKSSWHYRLLNAMTDVPNTICAYIAKYVEIIVVLSIALYIVGSIVSFPFMVWFVDYDTVGWIGKMSMMTGFSVLLIFIIGIGAGVVQFVLANWPRNQYDKEPQTYLIVEWLKGIHKKSCITLEFVDEGEDDD